MLLWMNYTGEGLKAHVNAPADQVPSFAKMAEFLGLWTSVAVGNREASTLDTGGIGKHKVAWNHLTKKIVISIARPVPLSLGAPDVMTFKLVFECLLVVDPPVAHIKFSNFREGGSNRFNSHGNRVALIAHEPPDTSIRVVQ